METPELPEPVAHMYPSDLEKFQSAETFAQAYSVAVGNPDERSVPLYTLHDLVAYAEASTLAAAMAKRPQVGAGETAICRTDGRCQYAIDHGAEGLGHYQQGKCVMTPNAK